MTIGDRIRIRRKELHMSADDIAEMLGVSRSTVFRWENGHTDKVSASYVNELASMLQTSVEYLVQD